MDMDVDIVLTPTQESVKFVFKNSKNKTDTERNINI